MCPMKRNPLTIVGIIALLNGFCTAQAQTTGARTCNDYRYLLPPAASLQPLCATCHRAKDSEECPTMAGLCDCETKGLREKVRRECPFMCGICTTSTTTIPPDQCEDKDICPTKYGTCDCAHKCENPVIGPRLRRDCPKMCGLCGSTPKPTTTTTTTTTTITVVYVPETCVDDESCPSRSNKTCDCEEKCRHPIVGAHLTQICPLMCGTCTTTTTTTTTSRYACVDDFSCPALVDEDGIPLCNCDSVGDMVRASCPVMCDMCDRCPIPRISENLASKTSLTKKEGNQMYDPYGISKCTDDPKGIHKGLSCTLTPTVKTHPCFTGSVELYCPIESNILNQVSMLQVHCQVCGGLTSRAGDTDSRAGYIEVQISWGPNMLDGMIDELVNTNENANANAIRGYAVYAVNDCGERQGNVLATVTALAIQKGTQECCNNQMYKAKVLSKFPEGVTSQSFMVVPVTDIGALDVGWVTHKIVDFVDVKMRTPDANSVDSTEKQMKDTSITQEVLEVVQEEEGATTTTRLGGPKVEAKKDDGVLTTSAPPAKKVAASVGARNAAASAVVLILAIFEIAISS